MAITNQTGADRGPLKLNAVPEKYVSVGSLVNPTKPSNRDLLVQTFGDQGITGFLELTGATRGIATADEVQWWEESRLHRRLACTVAAQATPGNAATFTITGVDGAAPGAAAAGNEGFAYVRVNDVIMNALSGRKFIVRTVTGPSTAGSEALTFTALPLDKAAVTAITAAEQFNVIGNMYAQGTKQPETFYQTQLTRRINPLFITKETFQVNGSQATNIGWVDIGNGDYRWFIKGEMDTRKRFLNQREAMLMYNQLSSYTSGVPTNASSLADGIVGSEGYFSAIENRGIVVDGTAADGVGLADSTFNNMNDIDGIILAIDAEGGSSEYAMYVNLATSINIDKAISAAGTAPTSGVLTQYGVFNNNKDMAVALGFKSFTRGGYTIHKHDWKLLNDPTLGGSFGGTRTGAVIGAMLPMSKVADPKTGERSPALEMVYKAANGYSRDIEHWVTGGGVLGYKTDDSDLAKFHYRSECALVTRAANQHVLLKA
jgi:hypothetical protein